MDSTKHNNVHTNLCGNSPMRRPYISNRAPYKMPNSEPCNVSVNRPYKIMAPSMPENMSEMKSSDSQHKFVTQLVNNNSVVVFSKTHCPHCTDTKNMLETKGVKYTTVELDKMSHGPLVQNALQEMTNARTVPRIFIDGICVGGNSDLKTLNATGKLEDLLKDLKN